MLTRDPTIGYRKPRSCEPQGTKPKETVLAGAEGASEAFSLVTWVVFGAAVVLQHAGATDWRVVLYAILSLTVIRMLPVALGRGDGAEWRSSMGAIVIGGMAASTLLTLLVVPVAYTLIDDLQRAVVRTFASLAARLPQTRSGAELEGRSSAP